MDLKIKRRNFKMKTETIYRNSPKHFLADILEENGFNRLIPSGYIVDKTEPGCGATQSEIKDETRNSIILEPFRTVIEVKKDKFPNLLGVYEGVTATDVRTYLKSDITPKKIMVTPESFPKVISALKSHDEHYRKNYFMLIDECEKLVQDCLFRKKILAPIEEFSQFTNKAMISATPGQEDLEAFKNFKRLKVVPSYDYRKELLLLVTNNIHCAARNIVKRHNDEHPYFIFSNCKKTIAYMASLEGVKDDYSIFCAEDLNEKFFQVQKIGNVKSSVIEQKYSKYNFFTSRFFSAVDMFLPEGMKAHILMISNVVEARHSIMEPSMDAVQIYGRIRRAGDEDKIVSTTHLTNLAPTRLFVNERGVINEVEEEIAICKFLIDFARRCPDQETKRLIDTLKDKLFTDKAFNQDGTINEFYKANFQGKRLLMFQYTSALSLLKHYNNVSFFKTDLHQVKEPFTDHDRISLKRAKGTERRELIALGIDNSLEAYTGFNEYDNENLCYQLDMLKKIDPLTYKAYFDLGMEHLYHIKFNKRLMIDDLFATDQSKKNPLAMIDRIITSFPLNVPVFCDQAKDKLQKIYDDFDYQLKPGKEMVAKASDLVEYFECVRRNSKKKVDNVYKSYYVLYRIKFKLSREMSGIIPESYY